MSDTNAEMRDHMQFVCQASGRVLINGLGLGMVLGAVLAKDSVTHVTVVELSQDVIDLVAAHYACDRLEVVCCSAFDYKPPKGLRYNAVWHDIWDDLCGDNLPEMTKLKRKYGSKTDWQGCWAEGQVRRHMKAYSR
jgi:spermidine synthase